MQALEPTEHVGIIDWLGIITDRPAIEVETVPVDVLELGWDGPTGAAHAGRTRASDSRVLKQHAQGTEIANVRQVSIVSAEDIEMIRAAMRLDEFDPRWMGPNIVVSGIPDFSHVPPSSRLQADDGTTLIVDMQNFPCHQIGRTINLDRPGLGTGFKAAAGGLRGVTAWVERPGTLRPGQALRLHVPVQRTWAP